MDPASFVLGLVLEKLFSFCTNHFKSKPKFSIESEHDLTRGAPESVSMFRIKNIGKIPAHDVICLVSATDHKTGQGVINNNRLFELPMLAPNEVKTATASGQFASFESGRTYDLAYTIQCKELGEPAVVKDVLTT